MATMTAARQTATPDLTALKTKQQAAWSSGNYAVVGTTLQIVGEQLCETLDLRSGSKVLDVAAGNGMVSLAAARRWCDVTSTDYVPGPARMRAGRAPPPTASRSSSWRRTPNTFRSMTPPSMWSSPRSASCSRRTRRRRLPNSLRVCKTGGGSASPTGRPEGFIGQVFKTLGKYLPPPAGAKSPALWGTRAALEEMFGSQASSIKAEPRMFNFRYRSPEHFLDVFRTFYGPVLKAFAALDAADRSRTSATTCTR